MSNPIINQPQIQRKSSWVSSRSPRRFGFTLVELLVVIGIIVILMGILLPAVMRSVRQGGRARDAADLQTISLALEAYQQDFGDIPRLPQLQSGPPGVTGNPVPNTGAATLGKALLGPYGDGLLSNGQPDPADPPTYSSSTAYKAGDCVSASPGGQQFVAIHDETTGTSLPGSGFNSDWSPFVATDFSDGPGFKVRAGAAKVWGPYLQSGKIKSEGVFLLDHNGSPILYFPAHPGVIDITQNSGSPQNAPQYVSGSSQLSGGLTPSLYDADENFQAFSHSSTETETDIIPRIRIMLGNYTNTGTINTTNGDVPVKEPYLLWAAGPDGIFGPVNYTIPASPSPQDITNIQKVVTQCDDVTNFR